MMCSADLYYQEFIIQGKELKEYKYFWLERLDKYHRNSYIDGSERNKYETNKKKENKNWDEAVEDIAEYPLNGFKTNQSQEDELITYFLINKKQGIISSIQAKDGADACSIFNKIDPLDREDWTIAVELGGSTYNKGLSLMRYQYKVREIGKEEVQDMEAMSLKKLKAKLDHKKEYAVEYTNKHNNFISTTLKGKEPK